MKRFLPHAILAATLALLVGCAAPSAAPPDTEALTAAANTLDDAFLAAFNAGDAEALNNLYWNSPEVVSFPPDEMMLRGFDAIKQGNAAAMVKMAGAKLELIERHQVPVGEAVIGYGTWRMTMPGPDGQPMEMAGRYSDVKAERDGKWVYLMDHASVPTPAEEPHM